MKFRTALIGVLASSVVSDTFGQKVGKSLRTARRHLDEDNSDEVCALPDNADQYSIVTLQNALIGAGALKKGLAIGGTLTDGTPDQSATVDNTKSYINILNGQFNFNGGYETGVFSVAGTMQGRLEYLATHAKNSTSGNYEVIVMTEGGTFDTEIFKGTAGQGEDNGNTLVIFNTSDEITLTKSQHGRQFGPTVVAPFSLVKVEGDAGFVDGSVYARNLETTGGNQGQLAFHGDTYSGPIECLIDLPQRMQWRSIEGHDRSDNLGEAAALYARLANTLSYTDGVEAMAEGANPRTASNTIVSQSEDIPSAQGHSDMVWQWGQFLDHDIDLTDHSSAFGMANIDVPSDDPDDIFVLGNCLEMTFDRSEYVGGAGTPRQQVNDITSFIDASNVYGVSEVRAMELRSQVDGKLATSDDEGLLLPFNTGGLQNAGSGSEFFLAGDIRANEHAGLVAMHTLFVREHNRLAELIKNKYLAKDEEIYQLARKVVGAEMQIITYKEFLPAVLGSMAPDLASAQFDETVDPRINNEFSTVAFRFGHSMLSSSLKLADAHGQTGTVALKDIFFNPGYFENSPLNVDHLLGGMTINRAQNIDAHIVDDVRQFLFNSDPSAGTCLDLAALNIHRGRDHGILSYNGVREAAGLPRKNDFTEVTSDSGLQAKLTEVYGDVENMDAWIGALSEDHYLDASVGELIATILKDQFTKVMIGDPFFYLFDENLQNGDLLDGIIDLDTITLAEIIRVNTIISTADNVFSA